MNGLLTIHLGQYLEPTVIDEIRVAAMLYRGVASTGEVSAALKNVQHYPAFVNVDRDAPAEACSEQMTEFEDGSCPTQATVVPKRPPEPPRINLQIRERIPTPSASHQPFFNGPCVGRELPTPCSPRPILSINMSNRRQRKETRPERPLVAYRGRSVAQPLSRMFEEMEQEYSYGFFDIFNQQQEEIDGFPPWAMWDVYSDGVPTFPTIQSQFWRG
ncbi:hypothetical protein TcWFU_003604 [Taenia crassiceps]|uniref:Uncharacterized protein n=1 Tax=Taenia crassiceps TaxID=6207 RepID=A0ABR4QM15_9CEST